MGGRVVVHADGLRSLRRRGGGWEVDFQSIIVLGEGKGTHRIRKGGCEKGNQLFVQGKGVEVVARVCVGGGEVDLGEGRRRSTKNLP